MASQTVAESLAVEIKLIHGTPGEDDRQRVGKRLECCENEFARKAYREKRERERCRFRPFVYPTTPCISLSDLSRAKKREQRQMEGRNREQTSDSSNACRNHTTLRPTALRSKGASPSEASSRRGIDKWRTPVASITAEAMSTEKPTPGFSCYEMEPRIRSQSHNPSQTSISLEAAVGNVATVEDVPPDGGYGWMCTFCVFMINANTWGVNTSWGIFLDRYLTLDTFPNATKFEYAMIGGLSISQALLSSPAVAASQKRFGTRLTMLLGAVLVFAGLFSASAATEVWQLFLSFGLCCGTGIGLMYIPAMALLPPWFSSHRSLAVGFATSGAGLGGLAYSLTTGRLIAISGPAWTWRILGFTSLAANVICALLVRERPPSASTRRSRHSFNPRDFARTQVILILCWGFLAEFGYVTLWYGLPSYATSVGLSPSQGAVVQALLSTGLGLGRPLIGWYSDRIGRINMALATTMTAAVLCLTLWILARNYAGLLVFAAMVGVVSGTFWSTVNPILAEVVGIAEAGSVFGVICFALVLPTTFAEAIALQLVQGSGVNQFLPAQIYVGVMFFAGSVSLWFLRSWKISEIENKAEDEQRSELAEGEVAGIAAVTGMTSSFWLTPRKMFMPRRV
ncbi:major facilitator superfamily domain-containing protein [Lasiosphaeria miniovina]|uniref:Major facilitator superfamily domain-containing protein n=1 Tax=Lasiosphaeria miniovina TaxID=1954250 RepID=A0AA39ZQE6_9PEZI|nr:major facilitator superfamily domain-containing protein [Lasiosphaeria miniovina]KAK0701731.1 major facilitator superfamily domain-containing protein [Lasiosphaeria miniovina]